MSAEETRLRRQVVEVAHSLFARGYTHGTTGNVSARWGDRLLVTPTGSSLGAVAPDALSVIGADGAHLDGPPPTKEAFLHAAILRARPGDAAAVHTHSTYAAALSCLDGLPTADVLPRLTAYYTMRIRALPLLPYRAPGDASLGPLAEAAAAGTNALLLSNHGPIVSAGSVQAAADAVEELEQTARLWFTLGDRAVRPVP